MTTVPPIQILMDEHQRILRVLAALETRLHTLKSEPFPRQFFDKALDFFRNYADGCHHYKEEDTLFPKLEQRGIPREHGPIGCMLQEHVQGRSYVAAIRANLDAAEAGDGAALSEVRDNSGNYIEMLRQHISKEDNILFRMAAQALTPGDAEELARVFADETNPKINAATRARYEALAEELAGAIH